MSLPKKLLFLFFLFQFVASQAQAPFPTTPSTEAPGLRVGYYATTCPRAEEIVRQVVEKRFEADPTIAAGLIRMIFHDCFVRGCDASILIDPNTTKDGQSEKTAIPNLTVRGFDVIDEAKEALEVQCPSTVSCADVITLAAREAVNLAGGPAYDVPTGRLDGLVSNPNEVQLPGPGLSVGRVFSPSFSSRGFTLEEMVTLLGAHTVGLAHCTSFQERLSPPDPTMDTALAAELNRTCFTSNATANPSTFLDHSTNSVFDNGYYRQILERKGVLHIDQDLAVNGSTAGMVSRYASDGEAFSRDFARVMIKMSSLGVITDKDQGQGEIRISCRMFNQPK